MRLCFVTPRYGKDIVGGAETLVRNLAVRLAAAGDEVSVLTTRARNHFTWANELPGGSSLHEGVRVHRYSVTKSRDEGKMECLQATIDVGLRLSAAQEREWVLNTGYSEPMLEAIATAADDNDALIFAPYLFASTVFGATVRPDRSLMLPCLHDEAYAHFGVIRAAISSVAGLVFNTDGERRLAEGLLPRLPQSRVVGSGMDLPGARQPDRIRLRHRLDGDLITYAGRREAGKNFPLLLECMVAYDRFFRRDGRVTLLLMGSGSYRLPSTARRLVHDLGFVPEETKLDAIAASTAVVNLSLNESLSLLLLEGWACSVPAVVHSDCTVTRELCEESRAGLWVRGVAEFGETVNRLRRDERLRTALGAAGRHYVESRCSWPAVIARFRASVAELLGS